MRQKLACSAIAAVFAFTAFGGASASAATEFGDNCVGNVLTETTPVTVFDISAPGNPLPVTAPSAGVITKWKVNLVPAPISFPQTLAVLRPNGAETVQTVGEATGTVAGGSNSFDTRIPTQAGDRVGLFGSNTLIGGEEVGNLVCEVAEETVYGGFLSSPGGVGSNHAFVTVAEGKARIPVSAVIEPDADGDGYGDETQDQCPQSAAAQVACPRVKLSATAAARKGLASISVTATSQATVTVKGTVDLGKGRTAKLKGGTQIVAPGKLAKFVLLFPAKLRSALKALPSKQSLTLKVTASTPNIVGKPTKKILKLHLRGQAKPKPRRHQKHA
jgi:hypothetical protein